MKFKIESNGQITHQEFATKIYTHKERVARSLKVFLMFFAAALVSVLIPILHFFLVPTFLICSGVMAYFKFQETGSIDLTDLNCPSCQKAIDEKNLSFKGEYISGRLRCYDCRNNIFLQIEN